MKKILIPVAIVAVVGVAVYASSERSVLKEFFQTGDKPTEQQFANVIDSEVNVQNDTQGSVTGDVQRQPEPEYVPPATITGPTAKPTPTKVLAESQKNFTLDVGQSATFRWTPVSPKPKEPVTYRLRVWQLMQGQNSTEAMAKNQPVVTREVTNASEVTVSGILTGPCRPPYLCDFVWSVEAISAADTKTGQGTSGSTGAGTNATIEATLPKPTDGSAEGTR